MLTREIDFLIIGSGVAGISYALKVAEYGKVLMLTKADEDESNTKYAQGGIAAVMYAPDSYQKHIQDTLICGDGICNEEVVKMVIEESTERINELINWGVQFDKTQTGNYDLAKEGGHSEKRVLHHKDITGFEIERALLAQAHAHPNIEILSHYFALDIITQHHFGVWVNSQTPGIECYGVYALNLKTGKIETIASKTILMASGGCGHVYESTTNPTIATGDGVAMVYRAKGRIADMEFIQFHPTALYQPGHHPSFLISEAVRGFGAVLRNKSGEAFMAKYDERKDLAPRDIVARAIDNEMKTRGDDYVYLDCTHLHKEEFTNHFPNIYKKCLSLNINLFESYIPVVPAAHYMCGGIDVDQYGRSSIKNLFAVGECSRTGLHGANRLASNSLLEALVYSHRAALKATQVAQTTVPIKNIPPWNVDGTAHPEEMILITQSLKELQSIMSNYVGIVRSDLRLKRAFDRLLILHNETENLYEKTTVSKQLCELRNMIKVGYIIIKQAMQRKESRGLHYNLDYINK
ncbi:MAG: L-aspartate oxidase [Bacteroidia bacterium]|nr:L-aspartate oxidase [Bacteroidia bacterium]MCZ2247633.1 L-aspartate oxidase [Bacteroidia bacterium]